MSKKVKIKVLSGCRVDGKSLLPGKSYSVTVAGAELACGARRAVYETTKKQTATKQATKTSTDPEAEETPTTQTQQSSS